MNTTIAIIGLGRMGANMARRLARGGIEVHGYDVGGAAALAGESNVTVHADLTRCIGALAQGQGRARVVWLMLPHGEITNGTIAALRPLLSPGDVIVDGGNANYQSSQHQAAALADDGLHFMDCGVSGGVWGLANGYCLMFGGEPVAMDRVAPFARVLAPSADRGWLHCGPVGSGHYVKMIHNGIEYGMMQAMAEGFALMEGKRELSLDLAAIAELWRHGSVVRSWLLDLTAEALVDPAAIGEVAPVVADSGEGRWTLEESIRLGIPVPVIGLSLMSRFDSQGKADTANRLLSLMRKGFGGHAVTPSAPALPRRS